MARHLISLPVEMRYKVRYPSGTVRTTAHCEVFNFVQCVQLLRVDLTHYQSRGFSEFRVVQGDKRVRYPLQGRDEKFFCKTFQ